jgi:hypothetical protein
MMNVVVGQTADHLLRQPGRSEDHIAANPKITGKDEEGLVVEWYYPDCTVELRRRDGQYRVVEVKKKDGSD